MEEEGELKLGINDVDSAQLLEKKGMSVKQKTILYSIIGIVSIIILVIILIIVFPSKSSEKNL